MDFFVVLFCFVLLMGLFWLFLFGFFLNKYLQRANQRSKVETCMEKHSMANFVTALNKSLVFTPTKEFPNDPK